MTAQMNWEPRDMTEADADIAFDHDIKNIEALIECLADYGLATRRAHFKQLIALAEKTHNLAFETWQRS